jgi:hypothetical protein
MAALIREMLQARFAQTVTFVKDVNSMSGPLYVIIDDVPEQSHSKQFSASASAAANPPTSRSVCSLFEC